MILTSGKVYFSAFLVCWENLQIYYNKQCRKNNYFMEKSVNIITINIFSKTTEKYTLTFFEIELLFAIQKEKER